MAVAVYRPLPWEYWVWVALVCAAAVCIALAASTGQRANVVVATSLGFLVAALLFARTLLLLTKSGRDRRDEER